jgi:hypothetical protein
MRSEDSEAFRGVMEDLCTAFNRPCTDALVRVFAESLKALHIADVKHASESYRKNGKRFPAPKDLMPERRARAPMPREPEPQMTWWAKIANKILLAVAYQDIRRGFKPMAEYPPMPKGGYGLPLMLPRPVDDTVLQRALAAKADYVRMAEEAEILGDRWTDEEFAELAFDGLEQILSTRAAA